MAGKAVSKPTWRFERIAAKQGYSSIAGIDEAGRGPLAGPVVAAAVLFPREIVGGAPRTALKGIDDSKRLSPETRTELAERIRETALAVGVGVATAQEIDRMNILRATHLAARRAVESLEIEPDYLLTDYLRLDWSGVPVEPLVKGDARSISIAAASIIAKVARDEMMRGYDGEYPGYGFAGHKGYPCRAHFDALKTLGPCTIHRMTFNGVSWFDVEPRPSKTFERLAETIAALDSEEDVGLVRATIDRAAPALAGWEPVTADSFLFLHRPPFQGFALLPECERARLESLLAARLNEIGAGGP